ncbi:MAG: hypothetical protein ACLPTQ_16595 [Terriglobales bacterium]
MKNVTFALVASMLLCLFACDQYKVVDTQDANTKLIDLKTCNCEIVPNGELKSLREQAELGKHVNRYQMRNEGFRTWRFDTATGKLCLLLTTDSDWKKPDIAAENCVYVKD